MTLKFMDMEKRDKIRIVYFNTPPVNALSLELVEELAGVVADLKKDSGNIRCLILTSRIEGVFIAGADLKMIKRFMDGANLVKDQIHFNTLLQGTINEVENLPFPVIAAINGHAMGGGLELALACDFRFMAKGKARVGLPEIKLGLFPGAGGTQRLSRLIGKSLAKQIIYNSEHLDAERALAVGIVDRIFEPEVLFTETLRYAEQLSQCAGEAISVVKSCIDKGLQVTLQEGLALEMKGLEALLETEDAREGVAAFVNKSKA